MTQTEMDRENSREWLLRAPGTCCSFHISSRCCVTLGQAVAESKPTRDVLAGVLWWAETSERGQYIMCVVVLEVMSELGLLTRTYFGLIFVLGISWLGIDSVGCLV